MSIRLVLRTRLPAPVNRSRCIIRFSSSSADKTASSPASSAAASKAPTSSCPANTNLTGLTWLKGQPPVLAQEDSEYPAWLWTVLDEPKPGDGTSKKERRKENREKIRLQNFMKSQ